MTSLLGFEQCVYVFVGVKGVDDVLAGRSGALRSRQGRRSWSWVLRLSRASVTCLLGVEHGVDEFFAIVKGVGDVLAGRGAGC